MLDPAILEIAHRLLYRPLPTPGLEGRTLAPSTWLSTLRRQGIGDDVATGPDLIASQLRLCKRLEIGATCIGRPDYPERLLALAHPPPVLFYRGEMAREPSEAVAIVGSRRASKLGREMARDLAAAAKSAGLAVISGMARGIDQAAHRAALAPGGTWAVLGCGLDRCYPPEAERLAEEIAQAGGLLSEFPPGCPPLPYHFPRRNRIIAALATVTVVVEAGDRSGALSTAAEALALGNELAVVPGNPLSPASRGSNRLLAAGAALMLGPDDLLDLCGLGGGACASGGQLELPWSAERCGRDGISDLETLSARTGWLLTETIARVGEWERSGDVLRLPGGRFRVCGIARGEPPL